MTLTDEEIRLKAVEISMTTAGLILGPAFAAGAKIENFDPFGYCDDIVEYVKTGKKPVQIKEE